MGASGATETYDGAKQGRIINTADLSGNHQDFTYDTASGLLKQVSIGSGDSSFFDYTGNNLTGIREVLAGGAVLTRVRYGYDAQNRLTSVTGAGVSAPIAIRSRLWMPVRSLCRNGRTDRGLWCLDTKRHGGVKMTRQGQAASKG